MAGKPVRDLGYIKWKDPLAWMERMSGKQWDKLLKEEKHTFNELAQKSDILARQMEDELEQVQQYIQNLGFSIACNTIDIYVDRGSLFSWKWKWSQDLKKAHDIDFQGNIVWYITSSDDEEYNNKLICESAENKIIWKKDTVSTQIAIKDDLCYYIKVQNYFRTTELCVCNAHTGGNERVIYKEEDKRRDLMVVKACNKTLYLKSSDANNTKIWRIDGNKLIPLYINSTYQLPLGRSIFNDDCVLVKQSIYSKWEAKGSPITKWRFPNFAVEEPLWMNIQSGHIITINDGTLSIWYCEQHKPITKVYSIKAGQIYPNPWTLWENSLIQIFCIKTPSDVPSTIYILKDKIVNIIQPRVQKPIHFKPIDIHKYMTKSADGTDISYVVIKEKGITRLKGQIIYVYGAYGTQTPIGWPQQQWYPLLKRKWAIVYALVRGSGDKSFKWAEEARRENRYKSVEDFEAVISAAQTKNKLTAHQTVIYGRSAGGIPVGASIARNPSGQLFKVAYTEAPYVDVLRTSTNPDLPLTIGEYEEFGNPKEHPLHFASLLDISPVDALPIDGASAINVIDRVGLKDRQVYAYESFKWIQRLRGYSSMCDNNLIMKPNGKYITFEEDEGHHYSSKRFSKAKATDLAILESWIIS